MAIKSNKKIIYAAGLVSILLMAMGLFYVTHYPSESIRDFNQMRDMSFVLDIFKRDMYWLSANPDMSAEYLLVHRTSSHNPKDEGNLTIKLGFERDKPVGFIAYHPIKFYIGRILFLDIIPEFRSKGWGYKLLDYAMKDLLNQGFSKITITTRTNNFPALKLYTRYGFKEVRRDEKYVDLEYSVS